MSMHGDTIFTDNLTSMTISMHIPHDPSPIGLCTTWYIESNMSCTKSLFFLPIFRNVAIVNYIIWFTKAFLKQCVKQTSFSRSVYLILKIHVQWCQPHVFGTPPFLLSQHLATDSEQLWHRAHFLPESYTVMTNEAWMPERTKTIVDMGIWMVYTIITE